jgi:alcohol dehydrogenase (NADP+)
MGATHFIATGEGADAFKNHAGSLDLIIVTTNDARMPLEGYIQLLAPHGYLVFVGYASLTTCVVTATNAAVPYSVPEEPIPNFSPGPLIFKNAHLGGSLIGSPSTIKKMLELAARENVKSWVQEFPMDQVNKAVVDMENGKPRYRYVLVNEKHKHLIKQ